ncbi:MAG: CRISPR-associated protein Cas5 [Sulfolobales archaeon]
MSEKLSLEAIRIDLSAYTASFRVPHFVDHQLTLTVPPLSTIFGIISAAVGRWINPREIDWLAYMLTYESKSIDLESIFTVERGKPHERPKFVTRNVLNREFLVMPSLTLYLPPKWEAYFKRPRYTLLLGRTQDIAFVESLERTILESVDSGVVRGVLLPFELIKINNTQAWLQSLPVAFTDEPQRRPVRLSLFGIIDAHNLVFIKRSMGWLARDIETNYVLPIYSRSWILND